MKFFILKFVPFPADYPIVESGPGTLTSMDPLEGPLPTISRIVFHRTLKKRVE